MLVSHFDLIILALIDVCLFNETGYCKYNSLARYLLFTDDLCEVEPEAIREKDK